MDQVTFLHKCTQNLENIGEVRYPSHEEPRLQTTCLQSLTTWPRRARSWSGTKVSRFRTAPSGQTRSTESGSLLRIVQQLVKDSRCFGFWCDNYFSCCPRLKEPMTAAEMSFQQREHSGFACLKYSGSDLRTLLSCEPSSSPYSLDPPPISFCISYLQICFQTL
jgi:hypothetical protein